MAYPCKQWSKLCKQGPNVREGQYTIPGGSVRYQRLMVGLFL